MDLQQEETKGRNAQVFEYLEEKSKGELSKVSLIEKPSVAIPSAIKSKLDHYDKLVRQLHKAQIKAKRWKKVEDISKKEILELREEFIDENDKYITVVIETANTISTISKMSEGEDKTKMEWDKAFDSLLDELDKMGLDSKLIDKMSKKAQKKGVTKYKSKGSTPKIYSLDLKNKYGGYRTPVAQTVSEEEEAEKTK